MDTLKKIIEEMEEDLKCFEHSAEVRFFAGKIGTIEKYLPRLRSLSMQSGMKCEHPEYQKVNIHHGWLCKACGQMQIEQLDMSPTETPIPSEKTQKEMFFQRSVQNPYPSDGQMHTAYKKGFEDCWNHFNKITEPSGDVVEDKTPGDHHSTN